MPAIASQKPGVLERYGISRADADRTVWTIDSQGGRLEGAAAVSQVLIALGGGWAIIGTLSRAQPLKFVVVAAYRWFAPRRGRFQRFGVTPECDEPGAHCE